MKKRDQFWWRTFEFPSTVWPTTLGKLAEQSILGRQKALKSTNPKPRSPLCSPRLVPRFHSLHNGWSVTVMTPFLFPFRVVLFWVLLSGFYHHRTYDHLHQLQVRIFHFRCSIFWSPMSTSLVWSKGRGATGDGIVLMCSGISSYSFKSMKWKSYRVNFSLIVVPSKSNSVGVISSDERCQGDFFWYEERQSGFSQGKGPSHFHCVGGHSGFTGKITRFWRWSYVQRGIEVCWIRTWRQKRKITTNPVRSLGPLPFSGTSAFDTPLYIPFCFWKAYVALYFSRRWTKSSKIPNCSSCSTCSTRSWRLWRGWWCAFSSQNPQCGWTWAPLAFASPAARNGTVSDLIRPPQFEASAPSKKGFVTYGG